MPYDELGNYIPGDAEPFIRPKPASQTFPTQTPVDQMRYELSAKRDAKSPLKKSTARFDELNAAINALPDQVQETFDTLIGNPVRAGVLQPAEALAKYGYVAPGIAYRRALGDTQSLAEVKSLEQDLANSVGQKGWFPTREPKTKQGIEFAENVAKVPEAVTGSSMGFGPLPEFFFAPPSRPALTGSDIRALKGEAQNVAGQVRDIPMDFQNAQSGFRRVDPITGKPTIGTRLQGAADVVGDVVAQRQAEGRTLAPAAEPMYAVRPQGSRLVKPTIPETANPDAFPMDAVPRVLQGPLADTQTSVTRPTHMLNQYTDVLSRDYNLPHDYHMAIMNYMDKRRAEMYPTLTDTQDINNAYRYEYSNQDAMAKKNMELYDEYISSDEGKALAQQMGLGELPTPSEFMQRHEAAKNWVSGQWANYIDKNLGAEGDPLVKLASQGYTMKEPEALMRDESVEKSARWHRQRGNMPEEGSVGPMVAAKEANLQTARAEYRDMMLRRDALAETARQQGLVDPAQIPEYAALSNPLNAKQREINKLEQDLENLQLGQQYEALSDVAVEPTTAQSYLYNLPTGVTPFYPMLTKAPPESLVYGAPSSRAISDTGLIDVALNAYKDIVTGKIPLDKVKNLTVPKYVEQYAKEQVTARQAKKAAEATYHQDLANHLQSVVQEVPRDMMYRNAAVIEMDKNTPRDVAIRRVSEDTEILDHCVGQGKPGTGKHHYTGKERSYEPLVNPVTGEKTKGAERDVTSYVNGLRSGKLASIRDSTTGMPVATLQLDWAGLDDSGKPSYHLGFVSGAKNGPVAPEYVDAIKDYLNSGTAQVAGVDSYLHSNTGIYDLSRKSNWAPLTDHVPGVDRKVAKSVSPEGLPRFVTQEDVNAHVRAAIEASGGAPQLPGVATRDNLESLAQRRNEIEHTIGILEQYERDGVLNEGGVRALQSQRTQMADIDARIARAQQQQEGAIALSPRITAAAHMPNETLRVTVSAMEGSSAEVLDLLDTFRDDVAEGINPQDLANYVRQNYEDEFGAINPLIVERALRIFENSHNLPPFMERNAVAPQARQQDILADLQGRHDELLDEIRYLGTEIQHNLEAGGIDDAMSNERMRDMYQELEDLNRRIDTLQNQEPPAVGGRVMNDADIANFFENVEPEPVPMPQDIRNASTGVLIGRMGPEDFAQAAEYERHLIDEANANNELIADYARRVRQNPAALFGEDYDPAILEYTLRVLEERIRHTPPGHAQGGPIHFARSIPAMQAELHRRA